ncbi:NIPSNAP family protein [Pseudomonas sp. DSP3-2-2]
MTLLPVRLPLLDTRPFTERIQTHSVAGVTAAIPLSTGVTAMLYDVRTYTCRPGTTKKHLALYAEHGYEIQSRHLGKPLAYLQTESGNINSYMHIWVYESAADRDAKRKALQNDPAWSVYLTKSAEAAYLISQENRLMSPTPFFKP